MMTAAEILRKGAEEIAKGWCQRGFEDAHGNACAMGAMRRHAPYRPQPGTMASDFGPEYYQAEDVLAEEMVEQFGLVVAAHNGRFAKPNDGEGRKSSFDLIVEGNDAQGRTVEEIVACMQKAAIKLEGVVSNEANRIHD